MGRGDGLEIGAKAKHFRRAAQDHDGRGLLARGQEWFALGNELSVYCIVGLRPVNL